MGDIGGPLERGELMRLKRGARMTMVVAYQRDTDTNWIEISAPGKKTTVKSGKDLSVSTSADTIGYGPPETGFINRIVLDGDALHPFCTFNSANELGQLFIFDW